MSLFAVVPGKRKRDPGPIATGFNSKVRRGRSLRRPA
jgi:hypothetical protein